MAMGAFSTHDLLNEKYAATLLIAGDVAFRPPLTCQTKQPKTLQDTSRHTSFSPHWRDSCESGMGGKVGRGRTKTTAWPSKGMTAAAAKTRVTAMSGTRNLSSQTRAANVRGWAYFLRKAGRDREAGKTATTKQRLRGGVTSCYQSRASWSQPPSSPPHISPSPDPPQPQPRQSSRQPAAPRSVWRSRRWRRECRQPRRRRGPSGGR